MSAISAATSDESTTKNVLSSTATSSYANIVQKDNGNDKEKSHVKSNSAGETAKKSGPSNSAATNVPSSSNNTNNKTDKPKVCMALIVFLVGKKIDAFLDLIY